MLEDKVIIDARAFEGSNVAAAVRKWIEEELRQHASMKLGLGPMNSSAGMVSLSRNRKRHTGRLIVGWKFHRLVAEVLYKLASRESVGRRRGEPIGSLNSRF